MYFPPAENNVRKRSLHTTWNHKESISLFTLLSYKFIMLSEYNSLGY